MLSVLKGKTTMCDTSLGINAWMLSFMDRMKYYNVTPSLQPGCKDDQLLSRWLSGSNDSKTWFTLGRDEQEGGGGVHTSLDLRLPMRLKTITRKTATDSFLFHSYTFGSIPTVSHILLASFACFRTKTVKQARTATACYYQHYLVMGSVLVAQTVRFPRIRLF